jgi:hypothetical protein
MGHGGQALAFGVFDALAAALLVVLVIPLAAPLDEREPKHALNVDQSNAARHTPRTRFAWPRDVRRGSSATDTSDR